MRVFLSSTKLDLVDERTAAWLALLVKGHTVARMEDFASATNDGWTECAHALETSDAYVMLLGHEYGSVLPDSGMSYTHAEYELAQRCHLPTFVFVKADFDSASRRARDAVRLRDLHDLVSESHVITRPYFQSTEQLAEDIWAALERGARPTLARPRFFDPPAVVTDPWRLATAAFRRTTLARHPFRVVFVDTGIALADHLPTESPSRLLRKALDIRDEAAAVGADALFFNHIAKWAASDEELFTLRAEHACADSDAIVCLVHGAHDYHRTASFVPRRGDLVIVFPQRRLDPTPRYANAIYIGYAMTDVDTCQLATWTMAFLRERLDRHVEEVLGRVV